MTAMPFNRNTRVSLGDRFGKFISHPGVQGTAAVAPAVLAVGSMLMSQPQQAPQPMPARQPLPQQQVEDQNNPTNRKVAALSKALDGAKVASAVMTPPKLNIFTSDKAVRAHAASRKPNQTYMTPAAKEAPTERIARPLKQAHPLMLAARGAASFLGRNAGNIANGVQLAQVGASMIPKKPQPPAQPAAPKLGQLALKKAMSEPVLMNIPQIPKPHPAAGPKRPSSPDVTPGAGAAFKKSTFVGGMKARAHDFGVGATDSLAANLNTFLTPTTSLDPHKFHAVDDSTPLR